MDVIISIDVDNVKNSEKGIDKILKILEEREIAGSFLFTGKFLVESKIEIDMFEEHEIGCHGYEHDGKKENFILMDRKEKFEKLKRSTELLRRAFKRKINVFRAPFCSIDEETIKILEKLKYKYDSSKTPLRYDIIGTVKGKNFFTPTKPYLISKIIEVPISSFIIPFTGTSLRLFGLSTIKKLINILQKFFNPLVFFVHPWEFLEKNEFNLGFRHNLNRGKIMEKLFLSLLKYLEKKNAEFIVFNKVNLY